MICLTSNLSNLLGFSDALRSVVKTISSVSPSKFDNSALPLGDQSQFIMWSVKPSL